MSTDEELISALLSALPSLADSWVSLDCGPVMDAGEIAHHVVRLMATGEHTDEIKHFFQVVEELLVNESAVFRIMDIRNWNLAEAPEECGAVLGTGLIEGIQNISTSPRSPIGSSSFLPYLGPRTLMIWQHFHDIWGTADT